MNLDNQVLALQRECPVTLIPSGEVCRLPAGTSITITQSLGGSYTGIANGMLVRVSGQDVDALGLAVTATASTPSLPGAPLDEQLIWDQMKTCFDPEIPVNIVDLGLIYDCCITPLPEGGNRVDAKMTLTAPGCGMGGVIKGDVEQKIRSVPGVTEVNVELVWDPPWSQNMMSDVAKLELGLM